MNIIPAILERDLEGIHSKLTLIEGLSKQVQIDLCDGIFGALKTWLPDGQETLPLDFSYEFDVMLDEWKVYTMQCLLLRATSIVAHVDKFSDEDIETLVSMVAPHKVHLGISVSNDKSLDFHADMVRKAKSLYEDVFIQVMGIRYVGQQGQPFDEEAEIRVKALKQEFPDTIVQVDGGVKLETIKRLRDAGADSVIAGSSVFGTPDVASALDGLRLASN